MASHQPSGLGTLLALEAHRPLLQADPDALPTHPTDKGHQPDFVVCPSLDPTQGL